MSKPGQHGWNHPQCDRCWGKEQGGHRVPVRLRDPDAETCCTCGEETKSGIYTRRAPGSLAHCPDDTDRSLILISTGEVAELRAEVDRLQGALRWLLHLHSGVSKGGGQVTDEEWAEALRTGRAVLET